MIRHRANPLLLVPGVLLIAVGIVLMAGGLVWGALAIVGIDAPQLDDLGSGPDPVEDFGPVFDGFAVFIVGCTVMTVGRYLWRGARRRGWRDRLGRLLIILGYLDICAALVVLTRFVLTAMGSDGDVLVRGLLTCLAIAIPGMVLTGFGFRLAKEEALMTAEAKASF